MMEKESKINNLEKKAQLIPITREEYEESIQNNLDVFMEDLNLARETYNSMVKLFNRYLTDKEKFILKFYKEDGSMTYVRSKRSPPGFKYKK